MARARNIRAIVAGIAAFVFLLVPGSGARGQSDVWQVPDDGGFPAFLLAFGEERYASLIYRRLSRDLRAGQSQAMCLLLVPYLRHRLAANAGGGEVWPLAEEEVRNDTTEGLNAARNGSGLAVPEELTEEIVELAVATADAAFAELEGSGDLVEEACVQGPLQRDGETEVRTQRVEDSGLLADAEDFLQQSHLRFLVGGWGTEQTAQLVSELLRIGYADGLVVDTESAAMFVDRLAGDGVIAPGESSKILDLVLSALFGDGEDVENSETVPEPDADLGGVDAGEETTRAGLPEGSESVMPDPETAQPDEVEETTPPRTAEEDAGIVPEGRGESAGVEPRPQTVERRERAAVLVIMEGAMGINLPTGKSDLSPGGQRLERDPSFAGRLSIGVLWPDALGEADLGLHLVGLAGRGDVDGLSGVAPGTNVEGSDAYFGLLPYLTIEREIAEDLRVRAGGGLGVAFRDVSANAGGAPVADGEGTALLAQVGLGISRRLLGCVDAGIDAYGTYVGSVSGNVGGAARRFGGYWDVSLMLSLRVALAAFDRAGLRTQAHCD